METPKGMRDFLPEDMIIREEVITKIRLIYKKYGFLPRESPAMEKLEVLNAKSGEEIKGQIYKIENSDIGLRFDLTVPLARIVSNTRFPKPFKNYCMGRVWRREEPQKGRYREFYQADADIIGSSSMRSEAELLTMANEILDEFEFKEKTILLNNRKILNSLSKKLEIGEKREKVFRELDKLDKKEEGEVKKEIGKLIGKKKMEEFFSYLEVKGDNKKKLEAAKKIDGDGARELEEILELCPFEIKIDLTLVRGLGYYTGPIYEIKLSKNIGTVISGGRYDSLLELYGQQESAVGISVGIERLIYLLKKKEMTTTDVFVVSLKGYYKYSLKVAEEMRDGGLAVEVDLNERNVKKQFNYANALGIPYVVVVGEKEENEKKINLKNMESGKEELMTIKNAVKKMMRENSDK